MNPIPEKPDAAKSLRLQTFIEMLHCVIPTLDRIKLSIKEGSGRIPQASTQLNNVTSAAETATVEILNALDQVTLKLDTIGACNRSLRTRCNNRRQFIERFRTFLQGLPGLEGYQEQFRQHWEEYAAFGPEDETYDDIERHLNDTKSDAMNIAMALQVQDITSQQIAGVNHMIETMELHLKNALSEFEDPDRALDLGLRVTSDHVPAQTRGTYDSAAQYTKSADRQDEADQLIQEWMMNQQGK